MTLHQNEVEVNGIKVEIGAYNPFNESQACEIIDFVKANANCEDKTMLIHCAAGISRSGAVATFIMEKYQLDQELFKRLNPQVQPNSMVLRMLRKEWKNK